jgi:broad specificity polyphosphatase/5'/3'-nucleotidase SurE
MLGLPAMAVSQERPRGGGRWDFRAAQAATVRLAAALLELPQEGVALNMNVPGLPPEDVRGLRITAVGTEAGALARGEVSVTPMRVVPAHLPLPAAAPLEAAGSITS